MPRREVLRRILLWGIVAVFFAVSIFLALLGEWTSLVGFSAFPIVGAIILTARPGNGVGWYLLGVGIACVVVMWTGLDREFMMLTPAWAELLLSGAGGAFWTSIFVIGIIYPTGRPETRLGRAALWATAVLVVWMLVVWVMFNRGPMLVTGRANPFAIRGMESLAVVTASAGNGVLIGLIVIIVVDLVLRWRRASLVVRLQYRWFVFAIAVILVASVVSGIVTALAPGPIAAVLNDVVATVILNLIPISIGIAVTRHGLYEINRVVSRTVAYAAVTVLVIGVYAAIVTSVTALIPRLPSIGVALATLAAAALFLPALRGIQRAVDRRFDRERYDAERIVDAFGERLRTQIDPAATTTSLLAAVDSTLQPASVGLWARGGDR